MNQEHPNERELLTHESRYRAVLVAVLSGFKHIVAMRNPLSPAHAQLWVDYIDAHLGGSREVNRLLAKSERYWRCAHHPEATANNFERNKCDHGCDMNELRWHDCGCSPATS